MKNYTDFRNIFTINHNRNKISTDLSKITRQGHTRGRTDGQKKKQPKKKDNRKKKITHVQHTTRIRKIKRNYIRGYQVLYRERCRGDFRSAEGEYRRRWWQRSHRCDNCLSLPSPGASSILPRHRRSCPTIPTHNPLDKRVRHLTRTGRGGGT